MGALLVTCQLTEPGSNLSFELLHVISCFHHNITLLLMFVYNDRLALHFILRTWLYSTLLGIPVVVTFLPGIFTAWSALRYWLSLEFCDLIFFSRLDLIITYLTFSIYFSRLQSDAANILGISLSIRFCALLGVVLVSPINFFIHEQLLSMGFVA